MDEEKNVAPAGMDGRDPNLEAFNEFLSAINEEQRYKPVPTGFKPIDDLLGGGFIRQQLVILTAAPGTGKTALAAQMLESVAKQGQGVLYINAEMSHEALWARSIIRTAWANHPEWIQLPTKARPSTTTVLQRYDASEEVGKAIDEAAGEYSRDILPRMWYNPEKLEALTYDNLKTYLENIREYFGKHNLPAPWVCLDYLQLVAPAPHEDIRTCINNTLMLLKDYAVKTNGLVFVIAAQGRNANASEELAQDAGRDSSGIEYSGDMMFAMNYASCVKNKDNPKPAKRDDLEGIQRRVILLKCTKSRFGDGMNRSKYLYFDGCAMTFREATLAEQTQALMVESTKKDNATAQKVFAQLDDAYDRAKSHSMTDIAEYLGIKSADVGQYVQDSGGKYVICKGMVKLAE